MIATGISVLDEMLSGGFENNSVVLLRGGPGSGKTTLALQILSRHLRQQQGDVPRRIGVFISLEVNAQRAIGYANDAFGFKVPRVSNTNFLIYNRDQIEALARLRGQTK